jgi:hypothetical protein
MSAVTLPKPLFALSFSLSHIYSEERSERNFYVRYFSARALWVSQNAVFTFICKLHAFGSKRRVISVLSRVFVDEIE